MGSIPTLEGVRQAFVVPATRIRFPIGLSTQWGHVKHVQFLDSPAPDWPRIASIRIDGGFHSGLNFDFAPRLNAVIGGKGAGKSTLIEILRYALEAGDALTEEGSANRKHNFRANAEATVRFVDDAGDNYEVRRSGDGTAARLIRGGRETEIPVSRRVSVRVFGQRELQELATRKGLLREFVASQSGKRWSDAFQSEKATISQIEGLDASLVKLESLIGGMRDMQSELADINDKLKIAEERGLELLISEVRQLGESARAVQEIQSWVNRVGAAVNQIESLAADPPIPRQDHIPSLLRFLAKNLAEKIEPLMRTVRSTHAGARQNLAAAIDEWNEIQIAERHRLQAALAEAGIADPQELERLQDRSSDLEIRISDLPAQQARHSELSSERKESLRRLSDVRRAKSRLVEETARELNALVGDRVRLIVLPMGDRSHLKTVLDNALKSLGARKDQIEKVASFPPQTVANAIRSGLAAVEQLGCTGATAGKIASLAANDVRKLISIEIDLGGSGVESWHDVAEVSPGQRATALLALVLATGREPLIIDQPEDDLDNRYIYDEVVKVLGRVCERRQVIVATHNANIPILGDAEFVLALDADAGRSRVLASGGLEEADVAREARQVLEGGDEAFSARHRRYAASK
jgi:ABC-type lipoprotein export system ATPase subunit